MFSYLNCEISALASVLLYILPNANTAVELPRVEASTRLYFNVMFFKGEPLEAVVLTTRPAPENLRPFRVMPSALSVMAQVIIDSLDVSRFPERTSFQLLCPKIEILSTSRVIFSEYVSADRNILSPG